MSLDNNHSKGAEWQNTVAQQCADAADVIMTEVFFQVYFTRVHSQNIQFIYFFQLV